MTTFVNKTSFWPEEKVHLLERGIEQSPLTSNTLFPGFRNLDHDPWFNSGVFIYHSKPKGNTHAHRFFGEDAEWQSNQIMDDRRSSVMLVTENGSCLS